MVVLSPHFAALACLCAALPIALRPVEAAHLYGREKYASSHSHHRTPSASPTHTHDGKHHGHKTRAPELPPLLRRYRVHDHMMAQNHHGWDPRDNDPAEVSRSAFARSRYRRELGTYGRRSSVYVSGEHGDRYLVSRTPLRSWGAALDASPHAYDRRQLDESNLVLGRIDIMGQSVNSTQRLASLAVDSTPIDWTSGQSAAKAFRLSASTTNQSQFILMPMDVPADAGGSFNRHVTLATEVFDANSTEMVMYCATYDPDPSSNSLLFMTPCTGGGAQSVAPVRNAADPCSDTSSDASSSDPHQSQIFSYDPASGKIQPMSATTNSPGVADDLTPCAGARVRRDNGNSTTSGSTTTRSSTSTGSGPSASPSQPARNVTLVYVPGALEVPAAAPNTTSVAAGDAPVLTTTITTTVVTTVTATRAPSQSVTPAKAAVSASISSTPTVSATRSQLSSSLNLPSSAPTTATSKVPALAKESLEVEVVGITLSDATSSSSTSSTASTSTTSSSSSSPSLNAQAVASSIENEAMSAQRRAFVSSTLSVNHP